MTPRLFSAQLTEEDLYCWGLVVGRFAMANPGSRVGLGDWFKGDKRDAELMLFAQQNPDFEAVRLEYFDSDVRVRMSPWVRFV